MKTGRMTTQLHYVNTALERRIERLERQYVDRANRIAELKSEELRRRHRRTEYLYWTVLATYLAVMIGISVLKRRGML